MTRDDWFTDIYEASWPDLVRFLHTLLGDAASAQDIAQESLLALYERGEGAVAPEQARFWLLRVARNRALNAIERTRTRVSLADRVRGLFARIVPHAEDLFARDQETRHLMNQLGTLPEAQRAPLLLRELEGLTYAEIADLLGVSIAKIKTDIFRARTAMRALRNKASGGTK